jgi:P27 family predicted phage terminase small subunit
MNDQHHPHFRLETVPEPPDTLSEAANAEWRELLPTIVQLGTARPADLRLLALLCELLADIAGMEASIRDQGYTIQAGSGGLKANPVLRALDAARRQAESLLRHFELAPAGRRPEKFTEGRYRHLYGQ